MHLLARCLLALLLLRPGPLQGLRRQGAPGADQPSIFQAKP